MNYSTSKKQLALTSFSLCFILQIYPAGAQQFTEYNTRHFAANELMLAASDLHYAGGACVVIVNNSDSTPTYLGQIDVITSITSGGNTVVSTPPECNDLKPGEGCFVAIGNGDTININPIATPAGQPNPDPVPEAFWVAFARNNAPNCF